MSQHHQNTWHVCRHIYCMHFPKLTVIHKLSWLCICQCACVFLMCLLTGVGAVVFGPVQTSILAHLEIEALPAEQPGHYALQLWFYTQGQGNEKKSNWKEMAHAVHRRALKCERAKIGKLCRLQENDLSDLICRFNPRNLIPPHLKHSLVLKKPKTIWPTCCILRGFLWRDQSGTSNPS